MRCNFGLWRGCAQTERCGPDGLSLPSFSGSLEGCNPTRGAVPPPPGSSPCGPLPTIHPPVCARSCTSSADRFPDHLALSDQTTSPSLQPIQSPTCLSSFEHLPFAL